MAEIDSLIVSKVYRAELERAQPAAVARACRAIAAADKAGRPWSKSNDYKGYTSYASLTDLPERAPEFAELKRLMLDHAFTFVDCVTFQVGETNLRSQSAMRKIGGVLRDETSDVTLDGITYRHLIFEIRKRR